MAPVPLLTLSVILLGAALSPSHALDAPHQYDYIVIGAGPAGLQMGYFLKSAARDYIILERANISGNFFSTYPRHDKLISLNKRHTGQRNKEFNMRHDWNSLLSDDESLLMKHYSKEMFPSRQSYVQYLQDYKQRLGLHVQYNTDVRDIRQLQDAEQGGYTVSMRDQHGAIYLCKNLIVATGLWKPVDVPIEEKEFLTPYEQISTNPEEFEGKSVLILGRGNSAFEVADSLYGSTNLIHMVGRSRVRLSWETHYVGDLRGVNNALLDTYQLKSLDGVLEADVREIKLVRNDEGRIELKFREDQDLEFDNFALRGAYDVVVSCLGWTFDASIFENSTAVSRGKNRRHKYPMVYHDYRSADFENIYYAGTITHSIDFRKSAGGFIHGFRYTTRALHHILEYKNHGVKWPHQTLSIDQLLSTIIKRLNEASGIYQMFSVLCDVVLIKDKGQTFEYYEEYPVNLLQRFHQYTGVSSPVENVLVVVFEYGKEFSGPGKDTFSVDRATGDPSEAHTSNFLHPVFYYYKKLPTIKEMINRDKKDILPTPDRIHHIVEDFLTEFTAPLSHILPLRRLLENIIDQDMREFFAEDCLHLSLLYSSVPDSCMRYLSGEGGLQAGSEMWGQADSLIL